MQREVKGRVVAIEYAVGGEFKVKIDGYSQTVVAKDTFNQLAIDAAFERRAPVVLELDGNRIHRVQSDRPVDRIEPMPPGTVLVTRISTQVNGTTGELIAEVFFERRPGSGEEQGRTTDPIAHLLCHGAYLGRSGLNIDLVDSTITAVLKKRIDRSGTE